MAYRITIDIDGSEGRDPTYEAALVKTDAGSAFDSPVTIFRTERRKYEYASEAIEYVRSLIMAGHSLATIDK